MAQMNFDASGVEPAVAMELLPPGKYRVQIVQSEMKPTKQGDGQMLWLEFDILDGPHRGRKLWERLNLVNASQQTVEIAQRQLSAICHAVDRIHVSDSEQLHFRPMTITLAVEIDNRDKLLPVDQQRKQNRIKGYAAAGGAPTTAPAQRAAPTQPAPTRMVAAATTAVAAPTAASPPWRRAG
jgi:hypothetical protein